MPTPFLLLITSVSEYSPVQRFLEPEGYRYVRLSPADEVMITRMSDAVIGVASPHPAAELSIQFPNL